MEIKGQYLHHIIEYTLSHVSGIEIASLLFNHQLTPPILRTEKCSLFQAIPRK